MDDRSSTSIPIDPKLPADFDDTPNERRPASHLVWWHRPFIVTKGLGSLELYYRELGGSALECWKQTGRDAWLKAWPSGTRYDVRCLDGGAWDRSTCWGAFATLPEALVCARTRRPAWMGGPAEAAPTSNG